MSIKNVVLGITGGIAVYKACDVVSRLRKLDINVNVIMTKNATEFVSSQTFQSLSQNYVVEDMFEDPKTWDVEHIALAKKADVFVVAPATANFIGKMANGIADDMLTTTVMATTAPVIIAPAMNTNMYANPIVQNNIEILKKYDCEFIEPGEGRLACGDIGKGKLATPEEIVDYIVSVLDRKKIKQDLKGKKILITAGPTQEAIDPVRYITNHSTGKMGYAIAKNAIDRGGEVTLISGPTNIEKPKECNIINVITAQQMYDAVFENIDSDVIIKTAAVSDYRPANEAKQKMKKNDDDLSIKLTRNLDIAKAVGKVKINQVLVGFAAETQNVTEYAIGKIKSKNLDFIVANDISQQGAGFGGDTNIIKIIDKEGNISEYDILSKNEIASIIIDKVSTLL